MVQIYSYEQAMADAEAILTLRIDTENPIELDSFVGAFTSLATEYRREMRAQFPDVDSDARIFVKEIRKGSYIADLIPYLAPIAPVIAVMDHALIMEKFVRVWGNRITALATGALGDWSPSKRELDAFLDAVQGVANDSSASSTLEAATFEKEGRKVGRIFQILDQRGERRAKVLLSPFTARGNRLMMAKTTNAFLWYLHEQI